MRPRGLWTTFFFLNVIAFLLLLALSGTESSAQARKGIVGSIRSDELLEFLSRHDGAILDVRVDGDCDLRLLRKYKVFLIEFSSMSADGVGKELEAEEFITRVMSNRRMAMALKRRQTVLVLCCEGIRARAASDVLADKGFSALYLEGGLRLSDLTEPLVKASYFHKSYGTH